MMNCDGCQYLSLLKRFLANEVSAEEFQAAYLGIFKHENRQLDPSLFSILDTLFGDVDSFVSDPELRAELELQNPDFYLDEAELRHKVLDAYERLAGSSSQ
jgi:Bacterial self-protective colicin-like immunity